MIYRQQYKNIMESRPIFDDNVFENLKDASDSNEIMATLGIESVNNLVEKQIYKILYFANDKKKMADIIGSENIDKLSVKSVLLLIESSANVSQTLSFLGDVNVMKLTRDHIFNLLYHSNNPKELKKILEKNNISKLSEEDFFNLFVSGKRSRWIADVILDLNDEDIPIRICHSLFHYTNDPQKVVDLLLRKKGTDLSDDDLFYLLQYSPDVELIKQDIIQENIYKLAGGNFARLYSGSFSHRFEELLDLVGDGIVLKIPDYDLHYLIETAFRVNKDFENVINLVFKYENGNLPEDCVCLLLLKASDLDAMAERIGRNNIAKLTEKNVVELLSRIDDSDKIASILGADNMNKLSYDSVFQLFCTNSDKKRKKLTNAILSHTEFPEAAFVFYQLFKGSNNRKLKKMLLSKYKKLYIWKAWWNGWRVWGPLIGLSVLLLIPLMGIEEYTWHSYFYNLAIWGGIVVLLLVASLFRRD